MEGAHPPEYHYYFNGFLSACRSATNVLEEHYSDCEVVMRQYNIERERLSSDSEVLFFIKLRNMGQHRARPAIVGGGTGTGQLFTYQFIHTKKPMLPESLKGRDVVSASASHLVKICKFLETIQLSAPYHTDLRQAFSLEGMRALGYKFSDALKLLGYPPSYLSPPPEDYGPALGVLSRECDPMLVSEHLDRLTSYESEMRAERDNPNMLTSKLAASLGVSTKNARTQFLEAVLGRIEEVDKKID